MKSPRRHPVGFAEVLLADTRIYRLRINAAEDLLDEGARIVDETGRESIGGAKLLLAAQAARAVHLYESIIALCKIGRGVPASMLNRALLEEALEVHWVAANPELAPARADEHERLLVLAERAMEARFGRPTKPLDEGEQAELSDLMKRFSNFHASWTLATDPERRDLVKDRWGVDAVRHVDYVYDVIQRQNNALLHPSPTGYGLAMSQVRSQINRLGPDGRWRDALAHGALGFYLVIRVVAEEFKIDKTEAARLFDLAGTLSKVIPDETLAGLRDGAMCPCGSGWCVEDCHRS